MSASAVLSLERDGRPLGITRPELRYFPASDMAVSVPDIRSRPLADIYTTVTGVDQDGGSATVRLAVNPLVSLVWAGGALTPSAGWSRWSVRSVPASPDAAPTLRRFLELAPDHPAAAEIRALLGPP